MTTYPNDTVIDMSGKTEEDFILEHIIPAIKDLKYRTREQRKLPEAEYDSFVFYGEIRIPSLMRKDGNDTYATYAPTMGQLKDTQALLRAELKEVDTWIAEQEEYKRMYPEG
jgi:hypothetical protein